MLNPLVFAVLCALIAFPFQLLAAPYDPLAGGNPDPVGLFSDRFPTAGTADIALLAGLFLVGFLIFVPLITVLGLYVGAGIYHVLVLIFVRPDRTDFEATFRVFAYTSVVTLLAWIPFLGFLVGLYGYYLAFVGIREMHETTTGRALAVVLVPAVLLTGLLISSFLISQNA